MATRFYLPASGTPPATPAYDANWERQFTGWTRRPLVRSKSNTALATLSQTYGATTTSQKLYAQWISETLDVDQTISGTVSMVVGKCAETTTSGDAHLAFSLRVLKPDGAFRGTLKLQHATSTEFPLVASAATRIHSALAITSLACLAGDRLVLEIGLHCVTPLNEVMQERFGDPSATGDFALTAGLTTDLDPWMELSANLTFGTPTTPKAIGGALAMSGGATKYAHINRMGILSATGALAKFSRITRTGAFSFSGAIIRAKLSIKALVGILAFSGITTKFSQIKRAGILAATGAAKKFSQVKRVGIFTFAGVAAKTTHVLRVGAFGFSGTVRKTSRILRTGTLAFSGMVDRIVSRIKALAGALAFTGSLVGTKITAYAIAVGGMLIFSGIIIKNTSKNLAGVLTFSGVIGKFTQKILRGILGLAGYIFFKKWILAKRVISASLTGKITMMGFAGKTTDIASMGRQAEAESTGRQAEAESTSKRAEVEGIGE